MSRKQVESEYWVCIVGGTNSKNLKPGADTPMRQAVRKAFQETTGHNDTECLSGWGSESPKVSVIAAVWSMDETDPLYNQIKQMLEREKRIV